MYGLTHSTFIMPDGPFSIQVEEFADKSTQNDKLIFKKRKGKMKMTVNEKYHTCFPLAE